MKDSSIYLIRNKRKMRSLNKQTELDETKPDRLASAMLIIGIFIVCQYILHSIISIIIYRFDGWLLPNILPLIFLGGIGIVYGLFRIIRGRLVTKQYVKAALIKSGNGAIAGSAITLVVMIIAQVILGGGYWSVDFFFITIPIPLFFGITAGGIGGLIIGNKWEKNKAAFIGGAIAGLIIPFLYILFFILSLSGCC
jgi:hypothetical protein